MANNNIEEVKEVESSETVVTAKAKDKKVRIKIPLDPINKNDSFVPVAINGHITQITRGQEVEVSEEIKRILVEAGYIA